MNSPDFLYRFVGFSGFLTEALVCVLAANAYQVTRKRALLLIAVSSGMGAVVSVLPELAATGGWAAWYLDMLLRVASGALYLVGFWLLLQNYTKLLTTDAQRIAPPNGGPAAAVGGSGATGGSSSVS